jgi:hypothetical protein
MTINNVHKYCNKTKKIHHSNYQNTRFPFTLPQSPMCHSRGRIDSQSIDDKKLLHDVTPRSAGFTKNIARSYEDHSQDPHCHLFSDRRGKQFRNVFFGVEVVGYLGRH